MNIDLAELEAMTDADAFAAIDRLTALSLPAHNQGGIKATANLCLQLSRLIVEREPRMAACLDAWVARRPGGATLEDLVDGVLTVLVSIHLPSPMLCTTLVKVALVISEQHRRNVVAAPSGRVIVNVGWDDLDKGKDKTESPFIAEVIYRHFSKGEKAAQMAKDHDLNDRWMHRYKSAGEGMRVKIGDYLKRAPLILAFVKTSA